MAANFGKLLALFSDANVEIVVIGGVAMNAQGSAYVTFDLDVCYKHTKENIARMCDALAPHQPRLRGAPENLPFRLDADTVKRGLNFTLITSLGDLDLLGEVTGIGSYDAVLQTSELREIDGKEYPVLSLTGLIQSKRAAGRKKDLNALPELEALRDLKERMGRKE
jgi:hypothetical protein